MIFNLLARIKIEGAEKSKKQVEDVGTAFKQAGDKGAGAGSSISTALSVVNRSASALGPSLSVVPEFAKNAARASDESQVLSSKIADVGNSAERSKKSFDGWAPSIKTMIGLMTALGVAAVGKSAFDATAEYDSLVRSLATVSKSAEDLRGQLAELQQIAKLPGIGFEEALRGSVRLQAAGMSLQTTNRALKEFANAVAAGGGSKEDLQEVIRQLSQMVGAGKLSGDELKTMGERIPALGQAIRKAFGTMDTKAINDMGLSMEEIVKRLLDVLASSKRASGGIRTSMDNMGDTLRAKMLIPLGRVPVAIAQAFGPTFERVLTRAEPIFLNLAKAFENFGKTKLPTMFDNLAKAMGGLLKVAPYVGGVMAGMFAAGVVSKTIAGISAIVSALKTLRAALTAAALTDVVTEAIATKGVSVAGALVGLAAGVAAVNAIKNTMLTLGEPNADAGKPYVPADVAQGFGSKPFSMLGDLEGMRDTLIEGMKQKNEEKLRYQDRLLALIERNTARTADAITSRRTSGGGELAQMGISGAELRKRTAARNGALYGRA